MNIEDITKPLGGQCPKCLQQKVNCTCPNHNFKVGDYVRYSRSYSAEQRPHCITKIDGNKIHLGDAQTWSVALKKWDPQVDDLVWARSEAAYLYGDFAYESHITERYDLFIVESINTEDGVIYLRNALEDCPNSMYQALSAYIEPFTGQLPLGLRRNK